MRQGQGKGRRAAQDSTAKPTPKKSTIMSRLRDRFGRDTPEGASLRQGRQTRSATRDSVMRELGIPPKGRSRGNR